ncbi:MAG: hypothetical protein H7319_03965 [Spirosoma sp.]|nr:hypothetical protein [Spirosoma sp.]
METNALGGSASFSGMTYPNTKSLPTLALSLERFLTRSSIGVQVSSAQGTVEGNQDAIMRWQAISFSPLYSYYSRQRTTRISLGPSVQWIQTEAGTDPFPGLFGTPAKLVKKTGVVPGLVIEGAVRFPAKSTVFIELAGRYDGAFGELSNELRLPFAGMGRVIPYSLHFSRVTLSAGIGLRLNNRKRS